MSDNGITPLSRAEFYSAIGLMSEAKVEPLLNPVVDELYRSELEGKWKSGERSPHGHPWATSYHASRFPGDDPLACGRRAMYEMMNIPEPDPSNRALQALADAGKAIEDELTWRFHRAGMLLSNPPSDEYQTGFVDPEHWLTASTDMIVLLPGWNRAHVIECKSKAFDKVKEMQSGARSYDPGHRRQLLCSLGLAHEQNPWPKVKICQSTWALSVKTDGLVHCRHHGGWDCLIDLELDPPQDGSIYYVARDTQYPQPPATHEFFFNHDPAFMEEGRAKLKEWQELFLEGRLPNRPDDWPGWSLDPCKYCSHKREACKKDFKAGVETLSDSNGVEFAESVIDGYDYEETRAAVLNRWKAEDKVPV